MFESYGSEPGSQKIKYNEETEHDRKNQTTEKS